MSLSRRQIERICVGCFKKFPQRDLLAVRRLKDGTVVIDFQQELTGRTAYLCRKKACFLKAYRRKDKNALEYGLKVKFPPKIREELEAFFEKDHAKDHSKK